MPRTGASRPIRPESGPARHLSHIEVIQAATRPTRKCREERHCNNHNDFPSRAILIVPPIPFFPHDHPVPRFPRLNLPFLALRTTSPLFPTNRE